MNTAGLNSLKYQRLTLTGCKELGLRKPWSISSQNDKTLQLIFFENQKQAENNTLASIK